MFEGYKLSREEIFLKLQDNGIHARKYFYPITSEFKCYRGKFDIKETPVAKYISERVLCLPLYEDLSLEDVDRICNIIIDS